VPELTYAYRTNAELIAACHKLGYVGGKVLDPTYGKGNFWTIYRPDDLTTNDLYLPNPSDLHLDFRHLVGLPTDYDTVTYDPPYKLNGTGGDGPGDEAFGVATPYTHWRDIFTLCIDGGIECLMHTRKGGFLLFKCMDQVSSGRKRWQTHDFKSAIEAAGARLVDCAYVAGYIEQPPGKRQVHFHECYSTMLIFRRNKR
jgi:hypothetical protein